MSALPRHEAALPLRALRRAAVELAPARVEAFDLALPGSARGADGVLPPWFHVSAPVKAQLMATLYAGFGVPLLLALALAQPLVRLGAPGAIAPYLADGEELLAHLMRLHHAMEGCAPELRREQERVTVHFLEGRLSAAHTPAALVAVLRFAGWVRACLAREPSALTLDGRRLPEASAVESELRTPVRFGARSTSVSYPSSVLSQRLPTADPAVVEALRGAVEGFFEAALSMVCMDRVRAVVAWEIQRGPPRVGDVARRLAVSTRSLQRYLGSEGSCFRDLVHEVRLATLARLMEDGVREPRQLSGYLGGLGVKEVRRLMGEV